MMVGLYKKKVKYQNAQKEEKTATNFFVKCGDVLVPVEVKYFENKATGQDSHYSNRKTLLAAFAEELPDKAVGEQ